MSFNPCFNGCTSATEETNRGYYRIRIVSILVLMDVPLQPYTEHRTKKEIDYVSILVLMDVPLQR